MTERPIGSVFEHPKYGKLEVIEQQNGLVCKGCAFRPFLEIGSCPDIHTGFCHSYFRSDHKKVIFKKIGGSND